MNRKQRRSTRSKDKNITAIIIQGKPYTAEEALILAAKERNLGNIKAAIDIYNVIIAKAPNHPEAYSNLGNMMQILRRHDDALINYNKALILKPDYAEVYNNRAANLHEMQRYDDALASYAKALELKPDNAAIYNNQGVTLQALKRYDDALGSFNKALELNIDYAEGYNNRGTTLFEMNRHDEALASYEKALALKPGYAEVYYNIANLLQALKHHDAALGNYNKAIELKPNYAESYNNRGNSYQELNMFDKALESYNKAIAIKPDYFGAYNNLGNTLTTLGKLKEAEEMFVKAIALRPDFANPLFNLANIRKYKNVDHPDVKNMQALLKQPATTPADKEHLYFSLGKIFDDCGLYDEAFEYYQQGNKLRNANVYYDPAKTTQFTDNVIEVFTKNFLAQSFSENSEAPIFVIGQLRSGTTLMASILSNHRNIDTAGELTTIMELTSRLPEFTGNSTLYPQAAKFITPEIANNLAEIYKKQLRLNSKASALHVVDKHPLNFKHLGFITMLFPKAKIIHCMRNPLDTCLSNYFQRFTLDQDYSFDLNNIGHFYNEYIRLMAHWRKTLPVDMIEVNYEDMIINNEPTVRRIIDFIGLKWDENCLTHHTNKSAVKTASSWQVRQPLYKQSVERWRYYEKHLLPLKEMLNII